jgi:hypothetical protein
MKKLLLVILIMPFIFFLFSGEKLQPVDHYKPDTFYLGGIQINEANNKDWVSMLEHAKMNTVEVTIYARQGEWDSDSLSFAEEDDGVMAEIRAAKAAGLHVILILRISLDHGFISNRFKWHGMVLPKNDSLLMRWFDRYQVFAKKWATIAAEENVDVFSIGSEMNALVSTFKVSSIPSLYTYYNNIPAQKKHEYRALKYTKELKEDDLWVRGYDNYKNLKEYIEDRIKYNYDWGQQVTFAGQQNRVQLINKRRNTGLERWRELIKEVRSIYKGPVTYAANFDNYHEVAFWDDLDFIGINAYFALRDANQTILEPEKMKEALEKGWLSVFEKINYFRAKHQLEDKPMLFTELGYINRKNVTIEPWTGFGFSVIGSSQNERLIVWDREDEDWEERKFAIDALYKVVKEKQINLEGILYWKLTTHDYHLPHEPFALHLTPNATDSLQTSLGLFSTLDD